MQIDPSTPPKLYHYCGLSGLRGIIESKTIWLSSLFYLNDNMEHFWLRNIAAGALRNRVLEIRGTIDDPLDERNDAFRSLMLTMAHEVSPGRLDDVFCARFSAHADALSQWRAYADDGFGFAIGFASDLLPTGGDVELRRVIYDPSTHESIVADAIGKASRFFAERSPDSWGAFDAERLSTSFRRHIWNAALHCKNPAFKEEDEWRLVYASDIHRGAGEEILAVTPAAPSALRFRQRGRDIVPYFAVPVGPKSIRRVVIGPKNAAPEQEQALRSWLSLERFFDVEIAHSTASYR